MNSLSAVNELYLHSESQSFPRSPLSPSSRGEEAIRRQGSGGTNELGEVTGSRMTQEQRAPGGAKPLAEVQGEELR